MAHANRLLKDEKKLLTKFWGGHETSRDMKNILSRINKGVITRPQRVVIYGVESVGKTTLVSQALDPLILDTEEGSHHVNTARINIGSWAELESAVRELAMGGHDFRTVVLDSIDWAEKLAVEEMLVSDKRKSIEDYPYGKGYTILAERIARLLGALDKLIAAGMHVCLVGHAKVSRHEPPDGLQAFDRYELRLSRQTAPIVKEWADALLFANFRTKIIEAESGKAKGLGGKERVIYTQRSAAYDAKCRVPNIPDEIPMTWEAVQPIFGTLPVCQSPQTTNDPAPAPSDKWEGLAARLSAYEDRVNTFLVARSVIAPGQTWRDADESYLRRVDRNIERFIEAVTTWEGK